MGCAPTPIPSKNMQILEKPTSMANDFSILSFLRSKFVIKSALSFGSSRGLFTIEDKENNLCTVRIFAFRSNNQFSLNSQLTEITCKLSNVRTLNASYIVP